MSKRGVQFTEDEFYHLYNRGVDKKIVFHDTRDYERFVALLFLCNSSKKIDLSEIKNAFDFDVGQKLVAIGAYTLMPNHFHILLTPLVGKGVSKFMQKIGTAYSMYYNKRYNRSGSLFEGKFKSKHAKDDRQLKHLFSYIHLNPLTLLKKEWRKDHEFLTKQQPFVFLQKYRYSSYTDFLKEKRKEGKILTLSAFPEYFLRKGDFKKELSTWIFYYE